MRFSEALSKRLQTVMQEKKISKKELIKRCKLSPVTVNNILEAKRERVNFDTVYQLTRALEITMREFFADESMQPENLDDGRK